MSRRPLPSLVLLRIGCLAWLVGLLLTQWNHSMNSLMARAFCVLPNARHQSSLSHLCRPSSRRLSSQNNPTLDWKGFSHSTSKLADHVLVEESSTTVQEAVEQVLAERRTQNLLTNLTANELLHLGSVWYLPVEAPRDPARGGKPIRLSGESASNVLRPGDYLRIHSNPRRFPTVRHHHWTSPVNESSNGLAGVVVDRDDNKGWIVIDKPAKVPVHMTVDNAAENVAACIRRELSKSHKDVYVSTPHRLDQNTSGLLIVATSKAFANYFADLLRRKTHNQVQREQSVEVSSSAVTGVHKLYRCLVCLLPPRTDNDADDWHSSWSVGEAYRTLQAYVSNNHVMRHYLEPSIRAPKRFVAEPQEGWAEALLKVRNVGPLCAIVGNVPGETLASELWRNVPRRMPPTCQAVVELDIELLTGRTHQIRGQLSAAGYPLIGDAQYGGAIPFETYPSTDTLIDRLALQCCEMEFLDPDVVDNGDSGVALRRSNRWNRFRLDRAWWTQLVEDYENQLEKLSSEQMTTLVADIGLTENAGGTPTSPARPDLLPARVSLSPGKNKYVLVRASHPLADEVEWFVKSAAPEECGGPYHGNVAQDLREWIEAAGYKVKVTGGGRIDFRPDEGKAVVYGFSYGFGRGDHARAATVIKEWSNGSISATCDHSTELY